MADLLVTGTDTGVGKTVIAAALILALRERKQRPIGFKPAESGVAAGQESDSEVLAKASGVDEPWARPLARYAEPLAPAVAADRSGTPLDPMQVDRSLEALRKAGYSVVVEGAGGVHSPLAWDYNVLDLAKRHALEAVIVGRTFLGTLNHAVLTYEALRSRRIPVRGIVLNGVRQPPSVAEQTNPAALRRLLPGVPVLLVPWHDTQDPLEAAYASVPLMVSLL